MKKSDVKKFFKKFWFVVWKDPSVKGWIISMIFIFLIIKLLFFPVLSLVTGTALPLAIVESCSMHHQGNIFSNTNDWYDRHIEKYNSLDITKNEFLDFSLRRGFTKGDILFIVGANPEKIKVGDTIIFEAGRQNPIIHRVINIKEVNGEKIFSTMGDNNNGQLTSEKEIHENQLIGKAYFRILPAVGWGKLVFYERLRSPSEKGFCNEN